MRISAIPSSNLGAITFLPFFPPLPAVLAPTAHFGGRAISCSTVLLRKKNRPSPRRAEKAGGRRALLAAQPQRQGQPLEATPRPRQLAARAVLLGGAHPRATGTWPGTQGKQASRLLGAARAGRADSVALMRSSPAMDARVIRFMFIFVLPLFALSGETVLREDGPQGHCWRHAFTLR